MDSMSYCDFKRQNFQIVWENKLLEIIPKIWTVMKVQKEVNKPDYNDEKKTMNVYIKQNQNTCNPS